MIHKVQVKSTKKVISIDDLPNGMYTGNWSGYAITFEIGYETYELKVDRGIRSTGRSCNIFIHNGEITVETTK